MGVVAWAWENYFPIFCVCILRKIFPEATNHINQFLGTKMVRTYKSLIYRDLFIEVCADFAWTNLFWPQWHCFCSSVMLFTIGRKRVWFNLQSKTWPRTIHMVRGTQAKDQSKRPQTSNLNQPTLNVQPESTHNKQITILEYIIS